LLLAVKFRNIDENALQVIHTGDESVSDDDASPLPPQAFAFEIDIQYIGIDINSTALRDMAAVEPIVREEVRPQKETPKATQQVTVARTGFVDVQWHVSWALFFNY
jgi:hypothetical protein